MGSFSAVSKRVVDIGGVDVSISAVAGVLLRDFCQGHPPEVVADIGVIPLGVDSMNLLFPPRPTYSGRVVLVATEALGSFAVRGSRADVSPAVRVGGELVGPNVISVRGLAC